MKVRSRHGKITWNISLTTEKILNKKNILESNELEHTRTEKNVLQKVNISIVYHHRCHLYTIDTLGISMKYWFSITRVIELRLILVSGRPPLFGQSSLQFSDSRQTLFCHGLGQRWRIVPSPSGMTSSPVISDTYMSFWHSTEREEVRAWESQVLLRWNCTRARIFAQPRNYLQRSQARGKCVTSVNLTFDWEFS